jgi:hypothetical protein
MKLHYFTVAMTLAFCVATVAFVVLRPSLPVMLATLFLLIVAMLLGQGKWGEYSPPPSPVQPTRLSVAATRLGLVLVAVGLGWLFLNVVLAALALTAVLTGTLFEIDFGIAIVGVAFTYAGRYLSYSIPFTRLVAYSFSRHREPSD